MDTWRTRAGMGTLFSAGIAAAALAAVLAPRTRSATGPDPRAATHPHPRLATGRDARASDRAPRATTATGAPLAMTATTATTATATVATLVPCRVDDTLGDMVHPREQRARSGGTVALSPNQGHAAVADADNNAVVLLAVTPGSVWAERTFAVGRAPAQVLLASDGRVFVTERGENAVSVYDSRDGRRLCRTTVAADPVGLALSPDERTVYVTSGITHALTAVNADTFAQRWEIDVPREPRGLVLSRDGTQAFITHLAGAPLSAVRLDAENPRRLALAAPPVAIERRPARVINAPEIREPFIDFDKQKAEVNQVEARVQRIGTPLRVGRHIVVPAPPPVSPVPSQAWSAALDASGARVVVPFMVNRTGREVPQHLRLPVYGGGSTSITLHGGEPEKVSFAVGVLDVETHAWISVSLPDLHGRPAALRRVAHLRIPSAVAVRPSDGALLVSAMGSNELAELDGAGANERAVTPTVDAPCGVAAARDGRVFLYSQFRHALEVRDARSGRVTVALGGAAPDPEVARGRELFYSANDARISSGGLACGGCHPDGRDDGLVWFLSQGPRQTPTLAGRMLAPFNWNGTQRTMPGNIAQTVHRLGGTGLPPADVSALAAYLDRGLTAPDVSTPAEPDARVVRGREVFENDAACSACHDPDHGFTDGLSHELGGLRADETRRAFDTPSLRFVADTAPYFHDGRYTTLRELLLDPRHHMGHADRLPAADLAALTAYLETL